jgi:hypothetical protein
MPKTLLKVEVGSGRVVESTRNYDFSNFIPENTDRFKYLVVDDGISSISIEAGFQTGVGTGFSSVENTGALNADGTTNLTPVV